MAKEIVALALVFISAIIAIVGLQLVINSLTPLNWINITIGFIITGVGSGLIFFIIRKFL